MASSRAPPRHSSTPSSSAKDLDDHEFRERVLFAVRRQIRPAEEVDAVRRLMAANLAQSLGKKNKDQQHSQLTNPLALVDADADTAIAPSDDLSPLQREFVEAVRTNVELRADFARMQEEHRGAAAKASAALSEEQRQEEGEEMEADEAELLRLQLRCASLQDKVDRYELATKHMAQLGRQPAAAPDFLDPQVMFRGCAPLPEMPRELMDSFTFDRGASSQARAQELFQRLKKENLRQTIVTQQQERRVAGALAQNPVDPSTVAPEVQVRALNAVKNHLIGWIETHLSKAGGDGDDDEPSFVAESPEKKKEKRESPRKAGDDANEEEYDYEAQLAEVQREYERHVELRKEVLTLISYHEKMTQEWSRILKEEEGKQQPKKKKNEDEPAPPIRTTTPATTNASLITPYIEKLQAIARKQKGLAQEKSHINTTLARHQQETRETLGHLAEESQLLARFPGAGKPEPSSTSDFGEATKGAAARQQASLASQLEPWLLAADAAKLATLETVAEKVEEGQMAVDEAMAALDEARKILNQEEEGEDDGEGDGEGEEDASREQKVPTSAAEKGKSIYAKLDGNLGLINE